MRRILLLSLAALVCGCATVKRLDGSRCTPPGEGCEPVSAVHIMNTNWLLLSLIPIASGDPQRPNEDTCRWFYDTVTLQNQMSMLESDVRRAGASRAENVFTVSTNESVFMFLLQREKMHTSAVLVKDVEPAQKKADVQ